MKVTPENSSDVFRHLNSQFILAIDLETTSLSPVTGCAFAIAIASLEREFYFPLGLSGAAGTVELLKSLAADPARLFIGHNLHFDLGFLRKEGIEVAGPVYCTQTLARVEYNDHLKYSLAACAERIGQKKDDAVKAYLEEHKLFTIETIPGKKGKRKNYRFQDVPEEILMPYALQDARLAYTLYLKQQETFRVWDQERPEVPISRIVELEKKTTKVIVDMEWHGIRIDRDYCRRAAAFEEARITQAEAQFRLTTGQPLIDSAKSLGPIFNRFGIPIGTTEKGNLSVSGDILAGTEHPVAQILKQHRDAKKRLGTYFSSFLYYSAHDDRIHASFNQAGTATGRFSSSSPNLQNISDEEGLEFPVRRAFISDPDCYLVSIDFSQMEYRILLEYAGQLDLSAEVKAGKDVHEATAEMMGVTRKQGKTLNFAQVFGQGVGALAESLGVPTQEAKRLRDLYFSRLPRVREFIEAITATCQRRKYIFNQYGRRYHFPDPKWSYKSTNYAVQGTCSDIMRNALIAVHELLRGTHSRLLMQVHDEGIISLHKTELDLIPKLKDCFIHAYIPKFLPMDCSVHLGNTLHDLEPWKLNEAATNN